MSVAYNGTGRPEIVQPAVGSSSGKLSAGELAIITRLDQLIQVAGSQGSQFARSLNSVSNSAAYSGAYSARR